tara:strand:+ start:26516 stop:26854 length:339 start_codon:yes stop_codon:yes gene_type:complete
MADIADKIYDEISPTGTTYSNKFSLKNASLFSLHVINSGLTGTLTLWVSNKPDPDAAVADWVQNTDVTFTALAGASTEMINAGNAAGRWYKVRYVHASGTANMEIWANFGEA